MKRLVSMFSIFFILIFSVISYGKEIPKFSDVDTDHWAYSAIVYMVENDIISAYPDGTFRPDGVVDRANFAALLYNFFDLSPAIEEIYYQDIDEYYWAYNYIQGATNYLTYYELEDGIYFDPESPTVREDVAVALIVITGIDDLYYPDHQYITNLNDYESISFELRDYVALAVELNIMSDTDNYFRPQATLTRAEACAILSLFLDNLDN